MTIRLSTLIVCLISLAFTQLALAQDNDNGVRHYLSLGTSLSVGTQPDAGGVNQLTDEGYADQLYDIIASKYRKLKLTKLGCLGETTVSMINGGICDYEEGSQLNQAVEFLHAHKGKVDVVTIDMGVNDILNAKCIDIPTSSADTTCLLNAFNQMSGNLIAILTTLRQAADPGTRFVAMNYYNSFLGFWFNGNAGQSLAYQSAALAEILNYDTLGAVYTAFGIPVADVAAAFSSGNFGPSPVAGVPQNVLNICLYTWMCVAPPVGPNIHANNAGYGVIAATIAATLDP